MESYSPERVDQLNSILDCQGVVEVPRALTPPRHVVLGHLDEKVWKQNWQLDTLAPKITSLHLAQTRSWRQ